MNNDKYLRFYPKVIGDWDKDHWIWFPTVQETVMIKTPYGDRVFYAKKNMHTTTLYNGSPYDNYMDAFNDALEHIQNIDIEDIQREEDRYEALFSSVDKYAKSINSKARRIISYEDLDFSK